MNKMMPERWMEGCESVFYFEPRRLAGPIGLPEGPVVARLGDLRNEGDSPEKQQSQAVHVGLLRFPVLYKRTEGEEDNDDEDEEDDDEEPEESEDDRSEGYSE